MQVSPSDRPVPLAEKLNAHPVLLNTRHGVFYPQGCDVFVFRSMEDLEAAWSTLQPDTLGEDDAVALSASQIRSLSDKSREDATIVAEIVAAELKQVDILRNLADAHGAVCLVVWSEVISDETRAAIIEQHRPLKVLSYGPLTIQERVAENPADLSNSPLGINERMP